MPASRFRFRNGHLAPSAWSSQRHWHAAEDEVVYILQGEVVLVDDHVEQTLRAGDCAGFKAGGALNASP